MLTDLRVQRADACLSDLVFDAWRAGELSAVDVGAAESHLVNCAGCRERQRALDAMASAFLERFPVLGRDAKPVASRAGRVVPWRGLPSTPAAWAGIGLAAGILLFLGVRSVSDPESERVTRLKGSERIGFVVRRGQNVFEGANGQLVEPGDQLRFVASTPAPSHLAILSRDARGVASVYYPTTGTRARLVTPGGGPLESAVELDDTLGHERLYGVFCPGPFALEPLRAELERETKLVAPPGCRLDELEIVKGHAK